MKRTLLEIYGLAVCFFALAYLLFVFATAAWHVVEISAPEFTLSSHEWDRHQSDEAFKQSLEERHNCGEAQSTYVAPVGEALQQARANSLERTLRSESRNAFQQLVRNFIGIAIAVALFLAHWHIAAKARAAEQSGR